MGIGKHSKHGIETEERREPELGLHAIRKSFDRKIDETIAKIVDGSLRSGQKIEYTGTVIVLGDINAGAEVFAEDNIVVLRLYKRVSACRCKWK